MRLTLTIDIDDADLAEFLRLVAAHPATLGQVPSRGPDRPSDRPADPDRPTDGRTLLGWADRHGLRSRVLKFGRGRGYPGKVVDWSPEQVADAYHELSAKPPRGSQDWGRPAPGRIPPPNAAGRAK